MKVKERLGRFSRVKELNATRGLGLHSFCWEGLAGMVGKSLKEVRGLLDRGTASKLASLFWCVCHGSAPLVSLESGCQQELEAPKP